MDMYTRFAKKYGSKDDVILPPADDNGELPKIPKLKPVSENIHEVDQGAMNRMFQRGPFRTPGKQESDRSFEEGFEKGLEEGEEEVPEDLDPNRDTEIMGIQSPLDQEAFPEPDKKANRLSRNEIVKLCDVFYNLATS